MTKKVDAAAVAEATGAIFTHIDGRLVEAVTYLNDSVDQRIAQLAPREHKIVLSKPDGSQDVMEGIAHPCLQEVLDVLSIGDFPMLIGPSGCGKTVLAKQVADCLGGDFGFMNCSGGVTEGRIFGKSIPNVTTGREVYEPSRWVRMYERTDMPTVFLFDEFDGNDENVLLSLNSALSVGEMDVPDSDRPTRRRGADDDGKWLHHVLATANTYGHGADRQYVGRNQLDLSTIERFVPIEMDYSDEIEEFIVLQKYGIDMAFLDRWRTYRTNIRNVHLERIVSTRWIERACRLKQIGWDDERIDSKLFAGWEPDEVVQAKGGIDA